MLEFIVHGNLIIEQMLFNIQDDQPSTKYWYSQVEQDMPEFNDETTDSQIMNSLINYLSFVLIVIKKQQISIFQDQHGSIPVLFSQDCISIQQFYTGQFYLIPGLNIIDVVNEKFILNLSKRYNLMQISNYSLLESLENNIAEIVSRFDKITLLFSGGIDSAILYTLFKKEVINKNKQLMCITLECQDIMSEDSQIVKQFIKDQINPNIQFQFLVLQKQNYIEQTKSIQSLIYPLDFNIMNMNLSLVFHFLSQNQTIVISGLGPDEYLSGYKKKQSRESLVEKLYLRNCGRDFRVVNQNNSKLICPYLSQSITQIFLASLEEDKKILRDLGKQLGLPDYITQRNKRAAQFGSGISKFVKGEGYDMLQ
ncbi:Asparagine synthase [Spironucleus salmonicida]|uniref:Asparagine synthase n=1 Tax=Spironucleus salmonicida TaxID=348837 RepID=V6LI49_9EUKA|nr:Asparagine synthase [Spironucleus salmonicida]|eukprot:EST43993.1 Asparagine synthase [Spironucleus salmonicida]